MCKRVNRLGVIVDTKYASVVENIKSICRRLGVSIENVSIDDVKDVNVDILMVIGDDRDLLHVHQKLGKKSTPLLGVSPPGYLSFLMTSTMESLEYDLKLLANGRFELLEYERLKGVIDGKFEVYALNEIAIFPKRSAMLMDYELKVNGDLLWRDRADGVIVATPTGSTAYALSAGGPMILETAKVFEVVPVNSIDPSRRPLILPFTSNVDVTVIACRVSCEVVADGQTRVKILKNVRVSKAETPAYIVKLSKGISIKDSMEKKIIQAKELMEIPPSAKYILKILELEGPLTVKEIANITLLPQRTIRHALSILSEKGLVRRRVNLRDARQAYYEPTF